MSYVNRSPWPNFNGFYKLNVHGPNAFIPTKPCELLLYCLNHVYILSVDDE